MSVRPWLLVIALAVALLSACGGGGGGTPTSTTSPTRAAATPTPAVSPAAATPTPGGTPAPGTQITLTISSVSPNPAKIGDQVTITFKTQPGAVIGLQITDSQGATVVQTLVNAGSDGAATYTQPIAGPKGTWEVQAAAAASLDDLLRLQAAPTPGPETADATFQVQ